VSGRSGILPRQPSDFGFIMLFTFRYTFVADHTHLACIDRSRSFLGVLPSGWRVQGSRH
jgi:hypothetical protein